MKFPKKDIFYILFVFFTCCLTFFIVPKIYSFFEPVVIAFIICLIIRPIVNFLEKKLKLNKKIGVLLISILLIVLVFFIGQFLFGMIYSEITNLVSNFPKMYGDFQSFLNMVVEDIENYSEKIHFLNPLAESLNNFELTLPKTNTILEKITNIGNYFFNSIKSLPDLLVNIIFVILFSIVFILNETTIKIDSFVKDNKKKEYLKGIFSKIKNILGGYVLAQIKLLFITFIVCFIGFSIMKLDYKLLLAIITSILDMLPFFGTGTILGPFAIISIFNGDFNIAIGCAVVYGVTFIIRRSLEPKLVGDSIGVSSIFSLFCMFIGFRLIGLLGLILGVPVGVLINYLYQEHLFDKLINSFKNIFNYIRTLIN